MADTLSQFGYSFQTKLIASLLLDKGFLEQVSDIIKVEYFDSESNQWIVNKQLEYFEKYRNTITLDVLKTEIKKITAEVEKTQVISSVKDVIKNLKSSDLDYIKDESIKFFKNQEMKGAILQSVDLLNAGNYNDIYSLFTEVMKKGEVKSMGSLYRDDLEQRYNEALRNCTITPWNVINELTDGGLGAGELGCIVGGPGTGKCVGKDTEIEIEYEKIGLEINNNLTLWFDPWEKIEINDNIFITAQQAFNIINIANSGTDKT